MHSQAVEIWNNYLREVIAALPESLSRLDGAGEMRSPRFWLVAGPPVEAVVALARGFE